MYRCLHLIVWLMACCGFFNSCFAASAGIGGIIPRQEEQVDDRDDAPHRELEKIIAEPMEMKMDARPADFERRRQVGRQTSTRDGMTTTTVRDANRDIKIMEDQQSGIVVEVTRNYGPQDLVALRKKHPDLVDFVEMFPDRVGNHEIELNLAIKTVYRSANLAELKKRHPEAFNIYRRYLTVAEEPVR